MEQMNDEEERCPPPAYLTIPVEIPIFRIVVISLVPFFSFTSLRFVRGALPLRRKVIFR